MPYPVKPFLRCYILTSRLIFLVFGAHAFQTVKGSFAVAKVSAQNPFPRHYENVETIGIPRTLLYFCYGTFWETFFKTLGRNVVLSAPTDKNIVEIGSAFSIDECCLVSKAFMGHVYDLLDRCDGLFLPCYSCGDVHAGFCSKFQSTPDMVENIFRDQLRDKNITPIKLIVTHANDEKKTRKAYQELALCMGASSSEATHAWEKADAAQKKVDTRLAVDQVAALNLLTAARNGADVGDTTGDVSDVDAATAAPPDAADNAAPLTILLVAHPYVSHDRYFSGTVIDALESMDATIIYADETDHKKAFEKSFEFSATLPWIISRELVGSILMLRENIDGIVILSIFPCGPDSMTNDAIMRTIHDIPILNLMIDEQSGTEGIETRVESFMDILRYQRKGGYIHA